MSSYFNSVMVPTKWVTQDQFIMWSLKLITMHTPQRINNHFFKMKGDRGIGPSASKRGGYTAKMLFNCLQSFLSVFCNHLNSEHKTYIPADIGTLSSHNDTKSESDGHNCTSNDTCFIKPGPRVGVRSQRYCHWR